MINQKSAVADYTLSLSQTVDFRLFAVNTCTLYNTFMLHKPTQSHKNYTISNKYSTSAKLSTQHGLQEDQTPSHRIAFLLTIPTESLTHITSFLDPLSLLILARTNKQLYGHINDDNTWRCALNCQFLGIGPEGDFYDTKSLLLRRTESSWKKEFVYRFNLRLKWEKSRTPTVTHLPMMNSSISSIHLVSEYGLFTSSIQYGVVSRSNPLTGKVWKGLLVAAGTLNGLGIGNPNVDTPLNVSTCSFTSKGNTAKILWGFRHGEVAVTFATRVLDNSRIGGARLIRCAVTEEHDGMVVDAVWGSDGDVFVSAGLDGRVKIWDGKKVRCLWSSEKQTDNLAINPCAKVAFDAEHGTIAVALNTGDIIVWSGLTSLYADNPRAEDAPLSISAGMLIPALPIVTTPNLINPSREFVTMTLNHQSDDRVSLLIRRLDDFFFYRVNIDLSSHKIVEEVRFGDASSGIIRSIKLCLARDTQESSFILVGDQLGCLSIYNWDESISINSTGFSILPVRRLEAFDDGSSITCIEWNPTTLVTGSSAGTVRVWDSLMLEHLRSFPSPWSRARGEWESVKQIILEREMLVVAVGDKVMSWKAGPVGTGGKPFVNGNKKRKNNVFAKWRRQLDIRRDIADSERDLEVEKKSKQQEYDREKGHLGSLDVLGLNELEALEYVMMLSRDEEESRRFRKDLSVVPVEDESRQDEFDAAWSCSGTSLPQPCSAESRQGQPSQSAEVEIVERESMTVGFASNSRRLNRTNSSQSVESVADRDSGFPAISSSVPAMSHTRSNSIDRVPTIGSPTSVKTAWSFPMNSPPSSGSAVRRSKVSNVVTQGPRHDHMELVGGGEKMETQEDRDIRYAIELSLAEARSRGKDV